MSISNIYLKADFKDKAQVKSLGARWDSAIKKWYVPDSLDLNNFSKWLPKEFIIENSIASNNNQEISNKGIPLSQLLQKVSQAIKHIDPQLEWIKTEVSEVSVHVSGHCYLELVEMSNGKLLCKSKAIIVKDDYPGLFDKFKQLTGDFLKPGMQVLLLVKLHFSIQYGFSLYIKDLDPTYTIGDLAAKLAAIRDTLQKEGIYNKNKQLKLPMDFTRVAVLSPNAAAGLGDFKREASLLEAYKLCSFYYYTAQFQGLEARKELANVLNEIFMAHNEIDFDVIVIIRGGGSAIDLAWLNDYRIAKLICESQVVVYSGIGHERDNTIIDEVAGCRFDTPSKVIAHIFSTIVHNAKEALVHATEIKNFVDAIYTNHYNAVMGELNKAFKIAELSVLQISQNVEQKHTKILSDSQNILALTVTLINQYYARIYEHNTLNLKHITVKLTEYFANINKFLPNLCLITSQELALLWNNIIVMLHEKHSFSNEAVTKLSMELKEQATIQYYQTGQIIEELITNIISLGPRATLNRGYAIVRDPLNKALSSRAAANKYKELHIEFYDGIIQLINNYKN